MNTIIIIADWLFAVLFSLATIGFSLIVYLTILLYNAGHGLKSLEEDK